MKTSRVWRLLSLLAMFGIVPVSSTNACSTNTINCPDGMSISFTTPSGSTGGQCFDGSDGGCIGGSYTDSNGVVHSMTSCCAGGPDEMC
jgi:hypothetical protein